MKPGTLHYEAWAHYNYKVILGFLNLAEYQSRRPMEEKYIAWVQSDVIVYNNNQVHYKHDSLINVNQTCVLIT